MRTVLLLFFSVNAWSSGLKICLFGDSGTGQKEQYEVAKALANEGCHHVYVLGDIIYPRGISHANDPILHKRLLDPYKELVNSKYKPKLRLVLGNHEYYGNESAWLDVPKIYPQVHIPNYYYLDIIENLCFTIIDSSAPKIKPLAPRSKRQRKWLQNLKIPRECRWNLAIGHHPYQSSGKHGNSNKKLKKLLESFVFGKYAAYISGHDHILTDEGVYHGTRQLISGTAGKIRTVLRQPAGGFGVADYGYLVLERTEDVLEYQFKVLSRKPGVVKLVHTGEINPIEEI